MLSENFAKKQQQQKPLKHDKATTILRAQPKTKTQHQESKKLEDKKTMQMIE